MEVQPSASPWPSNATLKLKLRGEHRARTNALGTWLLALLIGCSAASGTYEPGAAKNAPADSRYGGAVLWDVTTSATLNAIDEQYAYIVAGSADGHHKVLYRVSLEPGAGQKTEQLWAAGADQQISSVEKHIDDRRIYMAVGSNTGETQILSLAPEEGEESLPVVLNELDVIRFLRESNRKLPKGQLHVTLAGSDEEFLYVRAARDSGGAPPTYLLAVEKTAPKPRMHVIPTTHLGSFPTGDKSVISVGGYVYFTYNRLRSQAETKGESHARSHESGVAMWPKSAITDATKSLPRVIYSSPSDLNRGYALSADPAAGNYICISNVNAPAEVLCFDCDAAGCTARGTLSPDQKQTVSDVTVTAQKRVLFAVKDNPTCLLPPSSRPVSGYGENFWIAYRDYASFNDKERRASANWQEHVLGEHLNDCPQQEYESALAFVALRANSLGSAMLVQLVNDTPLPPRPNTGASPSAASPALPQQTFQSLLVWYPNAILD